MNRGEVYKLLAASLEQYRAMNFQALAEAAGTCISQMRVQVGSEEIMLEVSVDWVDDRYQAMCVEVTADGPSHWMMDRLTESIVIARPAH